MGGIHNKGAIFQYSVSSNIYTIKASFDGTNKGMEPIGSLIQANDGKMYGMTLEGGADNYGVLFEYNPFNDSLTKKLDFTFTNGGFPDYTALIESLQTTANYTGYNSKSSYMPGG